MTEIKNYDKALPCPFCRKLPTYREFSTEPAYVFCDNGNCPLFDVRVDLTEWNSRKK